ncbi:glycoside hydrolase family 13 protein [Thermothielavioides terrestris NRRL 8126]|uniref:Glycoside hydrolase family 13 protein n=1 Tax=Thermothielavioides terrestris (strain ATCC 38088 / NRRL 8126) TaxID=578455 RepID=G2R9T4_THETT|nr:glycoside hydrolase family 13 protein [Thermothielavioides terrestris NRRL 8126]AEO69575.1 glycoside hydrolase family 13 protein [Thermothielavioides terrestris NRRL 8126]
MADGSRDAWWKDAICYQIYPASFMDSNGDGLGDIPGILSKIDYLKDLGIDVVWVSPIKVDMGYDISDYEKVYPPYGTVKDMEDLIEACHQRGMKIILDLVINHTSDQHAWFKESRSSKDNPKRDWYIWRPPRYAEDGTRLPPTNWRSYFSGSTWEFDEHTGEYYLHLFAKEQPDLNWENEETRNAIYDSAMRFWLDKGVDGFRVDCVNMYSKGVEFKDAPIVDPRFYEQPAWLYYANGPRIHEFLREMNEKVLNHYGAVTVGELPHTPDPNKVLQYVRASEKQLSMVFQFDIVDIGQGREHKYHFQEWKLPLLKGIVAKWQQFIEGTDGWTTVFCENHDQGRSVSRYTSDAPGDRARCAKLLSLMLCALTGTLFLYQGQEIGMVNVPRAWPIEYYRDIESVNFYRAMAARTRGDPAELDYVMRSLQILGRDNARLPMQWSAAAHAGFTECEAGPWMRVHDLYREINVERQVSEGEGSVLGFWKRMIRFRKEHADVLVHGAFEAFAMEDESTFVFGKRAGGKRAAVVLNFTGDEQAVALPEYGGLEFKVGNYDDAAELERRAEERGGTRTLRPWEGRLYLASC